MVVCFPAGGGTDIAARIINTPLGEALGKPVIIENRGGAGGNIATTAVARLPADGYTLLVCSSAFVVNPSLYAQATYDPLKDFVPLMVIGASPNVFVVPAQSPIKSMKEFIEKAKAADGKMNWTSSGVGTTPQLTGELIKIRTGIKMQHVPYAGAGPATTAALAGQVDLYTANIGSLQALDRRRQAARRRGDRRRSAGRGCPTCRRWKRPASRTSSPTRSRASTCAPARRSRSSTGWPRN